jgi:hypothetical protein
MKSTGPSDDLGIFERVRGSRAGEGIFGKLTVGFNGDMPMTSLMTQADRDGRRIDLRRGEAWSGNQQQMEWSGAIQATKQGNDLMLEAWVEGPDQSSPDRSVYFYATTFLQKKENNFTTFDDMKDTRSERSRLPRSR